MIEIGDKKTELLAKRLSDVHWQCGEVFVCTLSEPEIHVLLA